MKERPIRLLIVTGRSLPARGGSQHFYDALARFLVTGDMEVTIAATRMGRETVAPEQPHKVVYGPTLNEAWRLVRWADIVHFMDFNYPWWLMAKAARRRTVVVYHTAARICPKGVGWNGREACGFDTHWRQCPGCLRRDRPWPAAWWKWLSLPVKQRLADRSDVVVNLSQFTAERFAIRGSRTILHGIDLDHFVPTGRPTRDYFLFASRLNPEKGCDVLLRAMARYVAAGGQTPLRIAGDGPRRDAMQRLAAELEIADRVSFLGELAGTDLLGQLQHARALILPVLWAETFGRASLEAMAVGTPVVASAIAVFNYTVREAGLVFPPGDDAALAAILSRFDDDPDLVSRLEAAGRRLAARFSLSEELETYRGMYHELVGAVQ